MAVVQVVVVVDNLDNPRLPHQCSGSLTNRSSSAPTESSSHHSRALEKGLVIVKISITVGHLQLQLHICQLQLQLHVIVFGI